MKTGNLEQILGMAFDATRITPDENQEETFSSDPFIPVDVPEKIFEKTFDTDMLKSCRKRAETYKPMAGRFDPFDYELMKGSVGAWSALINKHVITFGDACDHALKLSRLWKEEDAELEEISKRNSEKADAKANLYIEGTKEFEIEKARLAWRAAVQRRNEVVRLANEEVDAVRKRYHLLRDG